MFMSGWPGLMVVLLLLTGIATTSLVRAPSSGLRADTGVASARSGPSWDRDPVTPVPPIGRARRSGPAALLVALLAAVLAGCGGTPVAPTSAASESQQPTGSPAAAPVVKRTVLIDPGHNGGNAGNAAQINKKVPDGRGGTKPCNTTGTATNDGYPEHRFNWDVALRIADLLEANGVNVKLTRANDRGVGPCVDVRGRMAEKVNADAVVSIHADGAAPAGRGFHVAYPKPALNPAQGAPSIALATALRDALRGAGLPTSTYLGKAGLIGRSDLAGLNLSKRPVALVECANMRNADESVTVRNPAGRQRYAQAIVVGLLAWLSHLPPGQNNAAAAFKNLGSTGSSSTPSSSSSSSAGSPASSGSDSASGGANDSGPSGSSGSGTTSSGTGARRGSTSASGDPDG
jgi:N-acetylmuramoyl-L-alanine amidase